MVKLKTAHCPRCGAEVKLDAARAQATCAYCGTVSYAEQADKPGAPTVVVKAHPTVWAALVLGLLSVLIAALAINRREPEPPAVPVVHAPPPAIIEKREAPKPPAPEPTWTVASFMEAKLLDSDGDGVAELLLPMRRDDGEHIAIYRVSDGTLLRHTPVLERPSLIGSRTSVLCSATRRDSSRATTSRAATCSGAASSANVSRRSARVRLQTRFRS